MKKKLSFGTKKMLLLDKCDTNDIYYVFYSLIYQIFMHGSMYRYISYE